MKCFVLSAMALVGVGHVALSAAETVPLKGSHVYPSFTLGEFVPFDERCSGPAIPITGTSYGKVTHLGRFSETADVTLCVQNGSYYGESTWTAANGDEIFFSFTGQDRPRNEGDEFAIADYVSIIEGGNGRFEGASGIVYTGQFRPDPQDGSGGAFNTIQSGSSMSSVGSTRSAHAVPEPTSMSLVLGAVWGFAAFARRRTRAR
jgi:hypothetical protein